MIGSWIKIYSQLIPTEDRNSRMLLIKQVNKRVTEAEIKNMSKDIIDVSFKVYYRVKVEDGKKTKQSYGLATNYVN